MSDRTRKLAWAAVVVASATALSRLAGLAREVLVAAVYGVDPAYNTLISVSVVPNLVQQLFADAALSAAFVPVFTALLVAGRRERAFELGGELLGFMGVVVGGVVTVLFIAAGPVARALFPELTATPEGAVLAARLLRILLPSVLFFSVAGVMSGVLYSLERFTMPAAVSIFWNLTIIAAILLFEDAIGVDAMAWGMLLGTVLQVVLLRAALRGSGRLLPKLGFGDPDLHHVLLLMVPITITLGMLNFNSLVGTYFAQYVSDRAAAEIGYAFRLYQLPQGIFAVTIGTVLFPSLSRFAAEQRPDAFRDTVAMGVRQMVFVSLPFMAWFAVMPEGFVRLVYERRQFGPTATEEVAAALAFFTVGLAFANANIMLNRAFQSLQQPWLPLWVGVGNLVLNAVLCWALHGPLGVPGLTLSMATVSVVNFFVLLILLRRRLGRVDGRRIAASAGRALVAAAALAAVSAAVWHALGGLASGGFWSQLVALTAAVGAGGATYVGLARLMRLEELTLVWRALRRRPEGEAAVEPGVGG